MAMLEVHPHIRATTEYPPIMVMASRRAILSQAFSLRDIQVHRNLDMQAVDFPAIQVLHKPDIQAHHRQAIQVDNRCLLGAIRDTSHSRVLHFRARMFQQCIRNFRRALRKRAAPWVSRDREVSDHIYLLY